MNFGIKATQSVSNVLKYASRIATKYGSFQIGTEHLLYGLTCVTDSLSYKILNTYGVTSNALDVIFDNSFTLSNIFAQSAEELTPRSKEAFLIANNFASQIGHDFVGTEHLLVALLTSEENYATTILRKAFRINVGDLKNRVLHTLKSDRENIKAFEQPQNSYADLSQQNVAQTGSKLPKTLLEMGQDLTLKARENRIDPIIGRETEIARMVEILCRKTKNNPVLIGEAGVGKSAIVDGLALAIVKGNVPSQLKNKSIFSLELGGLMAGTKYRGALEEKLKEVINIITTDKNIIVFIDEIHTLMQAGSDKGEINPADMLKPYLSRGEFQTIGATTTDEYRRFVEKDKALERRFQPVMVNPPSVEQTIQILEGIKDSYEAFHKVKISHEAIVAAASLSDKYIADRSLPDKAIDLIDEASSRAKVRGNRIPDDLKKLEDELASLQAEKKEALIAENFEKASKFRDKINELEMKKRERFKNQDITRELVINEDDISEIISSWTGIPVTKITESEKEKLQNLENILHKRVIGQNEAVSAVSKAIRRARIGLKDGNRPIGSFMFLGQTGVGKTELCKALAEAMFDNENNVIRLDMSEYMEKHSVSKLIGSPPGYVGFDDGGQLTEAVRRKPYSVVLFDEIEKAHPDVFNMLLQVLDDGRLTDSHGRTVSFKNTVIILTSNIGVNEIPRAKKSLGFDTNETQKELSYNSLSDILITAMKKHFKPEFINRIDVITVFHSLEYSDLASIAKIFISKLNRRLQAKGANLKVTEGALKYLIEKGYDSEYGARPLRRLIEQEIEDHIAEFMIDGTIKSGNTIVITAADGKLSLKMEEKSDK